MPDIKKILGDRVRRFRKDAGLTQEKLAEKVDVAVETISRLERGHSIPSVEKFYEIAQAIDVEMTVLFDIADEDFKSRTYPHMAEMRELLRPAKKAHQKMIVEVVKRVLEEVG